MKNWKIKRMPEYRIYEWLRAIKQLMNHYLKKEGIRYHDSCPFCRIPPNECDGCLWQIIEGKDCSEFSDELYPNSSTVDMRTYPQYKKWWDIRLIQLKNWKKILKAELARRNND